MLITPGLGKGLGLTVALLAALSLAGCVAPPPRGTFARVPTPADPPPLPGRKPFASDDGRLALARLEPVAVAPLPVAATAAATPATPRKDTLLAFKPVAPAVVGLPVYVVRAKDTVYAVSRRYGAPIRGVIEYNGLLPPYTLSIGQRLRIPVRRRHSVGKGETVYAIARAYGVELAALTRLNRLPPPHTIKPGQALVIPVPPLGGVAGVAGKSIDPGPASPAAGSARATPAAIPQPPPRAGRKFLWPVKGKVILVYGPKKDGRHNDGINIQAPRGTPVVAAENGVVAYRGNELRGFGNLLLIKHAGGWVTAYAHADEILVKRGQTVRRGQAIGRVGSTGNVFKPQLHFEVRKGTRAVNPSGLMGPMTAASLE